ncbi:MAG: TetR/AcrR family transcriptional regulator [Bacteroidales bacterium]|nr:TetR/AcrR family transcriptional regulator [Bacteroidales bacterium]
MSAYIKGKQSREEIINRSRQIFNEHGIHLTLAKLAEFMNTTLGRLTHHFGNKDLLFIAIAKDYELKLAELRNNRKNDQISLDNFVNTFTQVMDLQYDYRCAMRYIISSVNSSGDMKKHLQETYSNNREQIRKTIEAYVNGGSLQSRILCEDTYKVFLFQFTNLFTNWVINLELYDSDKEYMAIKPVYLNGIISVFVPFLTEKGRQELAENDILTNYFKSCD